METLERFSAAELCRALRRYREVLSAHREELNRLNVYPVPDGDTGTNLFLTLESVMGEIGALDRPHDMAAACQAISHGSLMGARGNSGVILSQILRGMADSFVGVAEVGPVELTAGLRRAADAAYQAVLRPVEGTILTVCRRAAEEAEVATAAGASTVGEVLDRACEAAAAAVEDSPRLLPALAQAGVVDAGGRGLYLLLCTLRELATGEPVPAPEVVAEGAGAQTDVVHHASGPVDGPRFEVMFLLDAPDAGVDVMRPRWGALGDSIVIVGGGGLWNCHVHTDDIGGAIEAGIAAGRPYQIRVTDLYGEGAGAHDDSVLAGADGVDVARVDTAVTGVVAVGAGDGLRTLLVSLGAGAIVTGGQSANPSTAELLDGVNRCGGKSVILLPNNGNVVPVARRVPELADRPVGVVPTRSIPAGVAAMAALDPDASLEDNVAAMTEAADRVRAGEVTQAVRDATVEAGAVSAGDWIGVEGDGVHVVAASAADAVIALVDRLLDTDGELVTVLVGADALASDTERLLEHLAAAHPDVEAEVHDGGQPLYPYLLGVE